MSLSIENDFHIIYVPVCSNKCFKNLMYFGA